MTNTTIQIYLQALGLYCGLIDGKNGPMQKAGVKDFQGLNGLVKDGSCGPKTSPVLTAAYNSRDKSKLSAHFKLSEFRCGCRGKYCSGYPVAVSPYLIGILEKLRTSCGNKPITITSGLRCKRYNSSLAGSSSTSAHLSGKAADIYIPGIALATIKARAYNYGAKYSYYGTSNMGNAVHINV